MKKFISLVLSLALLSTLFVLPMSAATTLPTLSGTLINGVLTVTVNGVKADTYPQVNIVAVNNTKTAPDLDPATKKPVATVGTVQVSQGYSVQFANRKGADYIVMATLKLPDGTDGPKLTQIEVKPIISTVLGVSYSIFAAKQGWSNQCADGAISGSTAHLFAVQAVKMNMTGGTGIPKGAKLSYKVYLRGHGWQNVVSNGTLAGSSKAGIAIEAIKVSVSGLTGYAVKYQVYLQSKKWLGWQTTANGTAIDSAVASGAAGKNLMIQAIRVQIVKVS